MRRSALPFTQSGRHRHRHIHDRQRLAAGRPDPSASGVLSGSPQVPGTFPITVTVDRLERLHRKSPTYTLVIAARPSLSRTRVPIPETYNARR